MPLLGWPVELKRSAPPRTGYCPTGGASAAEETRYVPCKMQMQMQMQMEDC
jgi:hypothetical protein